MVPDRPVTWPTATTTGCGSTRRALEVAGITDDLARPRATATSSATRTGAPDRHAARGRDGPVGHVLPTADDDEILRAVCSRASATCTRWASPAGRTPSSGAYAGMRDAGPTYARAPPHGDLTASVVGALWWERDRGERADRRARREAAPRLLATAGSAATSGQDHAGRRRRERHRRAVEPYLDRCGHATTNTGISFVDPVALRALRPRLDEARLPGPRARHRRPRRARGARRLRGHRPEPAGHHIAHLQLVHPDDVRRFAELGVAANIQALWACLRRPDDRADASRSSAPERAARQYPFGDLHRAGARLVDGQRLAGQHAPTRSRRSTPPCTARRTASRAGRHGPVPAGAGARPRGRLRGLHQRVGVGEPPRRRRVDRAPARSPTSWSSTATRSRRPAEIGAARVRSTWVDGECVFEA